jgi:UMF1 family MFS transporter
MTAELPAAPAIRPGRAPLLEKLGLHRPELRAWAMYDWGISAMQTVITTAVFPIYFIKVAAAGLPGSAATKALADANVIGAVIVAVLAPFLGALSDYSAIKKRMLGGTMAIALAATAAMFLVGRGEVGLATTLYVLCLVGATASLAFYESLLPHIAAPDEMDRVSTGGYALGYFGGGLLLAINLAWILKPAAFGLPEGTLPTRLAFVSVAVWWLLFAIPLFRRVPEPPRALEPDERSGESAVRAAVVRLGETLRELRGYRNAFLMLLAFMIYNDGIQTIIKMATAYGTEIGIGESALIAAILIVQFVGVPCAFLFGVLAGRIGARRSIFLGLVVYTLISVLGYFMTSATHFFVLAALVGLVQGGTQALSRSLFASMIPRHKSGEFFGFYSVFEKFAGIFGPLLFSLAITLTGTSRASILSVIVFFALGAALLALVDVDAGVRAARAADAEASAEAGADGERGGVPAAAPAGGGAG